MVENHRRGADGNDLITVGNIHYRSTGTGDVVDPDEPTGPAHPHVGSGARLANDRHGTTRLPLQQGPT